MNRNRHLTLASLAWRNLHTRPGRTLLTLLGIAMGVAAILATDITNRNVAATLDGLFARALGSAELEIAPPVNEDTIDEAVLGLVQRFPGVQLAVPTIRTITVLPGLLDEGQPVQNANGQVAMGKRVEIDGIDLALEPKIRDYNIITGRFPETGKYEALISQQFAEQNDLEVEDELLLFGSSTAEMTETASLLPAEAAGIRNGFMDSTALASLVPQAFSKWHNLELGRAEQKPTTFDTRKITITGILADEGAAVTNAGDVIFIPLEVAQEIFSLEQSFSEISIQVQTGMGDDPQSLAGLKTALESRLGSAVRVTYPSGRADLVPRMASSYQVALTFFSIIALFMGAFLIYNTFATSVIERTQEIGMLRAIGLQRRQVMHLVLMEAGFLSLLGCLLGLGIGVFLARGLMLLMRGFFQVEGSALAFSLVDVVKSVSIGLMVTLLATLLPARQAACISPVEALTVRGRSSRNFHPAVWVGGLAFLGSGWLFLHQPTGGPAQILTIVRMAGFAIFLFGAILTVPLAVISLDPFTRRLTTCLFGSVGELGARNARRAVWRTMVTVASLVIALIMIILVDSMVFVIKGDVSNWLDNALGADVLVLAPYPMRESFTQKLEGIPGVQAVSPSRAIEVEVARSSGLITNQQDEQLTYLAIDPQQFRQVGDKELVAGQGDPEAAWAAFNQGNALFISSVVADQYDLEQGSQLALKTRRGQQEFVVVGITTEFEHDGMVVTGTYSDLKRLFGESGADLFAVEVAPGYNTDEVAQAITNRFEAREGIQVQTTQTFKAGVMENYNRISSLFNVLVLVGVIIGTMGLVNTMTMNILERRRELGMLRALGSTRGQLVRVVLAEALTIGLVSAIYGILFGFILTRVMIPVTNLITGYDLQYAFNVRPYLVSLVIALGVSQFATLAPARHAARVNIIQSLKHE
jgi:putative ABC transport system permease protein